MRLFYIAICFFLSSACQSVKQDDESSENRLTDSAHVRYDSSLAQKLGANKYGLKKYTLCFLSKGKSKVLNAEDYRAIEEAHIDYIQALVAQKEIIMAGYFDGKDELLGFVVFNSLDTNYVRSLLAKDPKVAKELIFPVLKKWTSSAAIQELNQIHQRIEKTPM